MNTSKEKVSRFPPPDAHFTKRNELGFWVRRSVSSKPVMPPDTTLLDGDPEAEEVEWKDKGLSEADLATLATLGPVLPALVKLRL